jgi:hypothetical protein
MERDITPKKCASLGHELKILIIYAAGALLVRRGKALE